MCAALFKPHFFQDMRHRVADCGCGRKGKIHDAERHAKPLRSFLCHKLADARDLERGFLDGIRHVRDVAVRDLLQRRAHHAGAGDTDVDHAVRLARAVECPRHKGIVLGRIAEHDELGGADAALIGGRLRRAANDLPHGRYGVHVDARLRRADVDARTDMLRFGKRFGDAVYERAVPRRKALLHKRRIPADEIHTHRPCGALQRFGIEHGIAAACGDKHGNGRNGNALVDDRDAVFLFDLLARLHKAARAPADLFIDLLAGIMNIGIRTA